MCCQYACTRSDKTTSLRTLSLPFRSVSPNSPFNPWYPECTARAPCLPSLVVFPVRRCNALFAYLLSLTRAFDDSIYCPNCKTTVSTLIKRLVSAFVYVCLARASAAVSISGGAEARAMRK